MQHQFEEEPTLLTTRARLTGAMYIPYLLFGIPLFLRSKLIVPTDAAATAAHILASTNLYRATIVTDLISYLLYIALTYLFYSLLRPVNRAWAAVATLFTLSGCVVLIMSSALLMTPLLLLGDGAFQAIDPAQRQDLALVALKLFSFGYTIGLLLFGAQWLIMGPLFAKSRLVPKLIGYSLFAGGVGWVAFAIATILGSPFRLALQRIVMPIGGISELALAAWLVIFAGWHAAKEGSSETP